MPEEPLLVSEETKADDACAIGISKNCENKSTNLKKRKKRNSVENFDAKNKPHRMAPQKRKRVCNKSRPILKISLSLFSNRKTKRNISPSSGTSDEKIESQTCGSDEEGRKNGVKDDGEDDNVITREMPDNTQAKERKRIYKPRLSKVCDLCDKVFADSSSFAKHKRIHINERPYKCEQCHKGFRQSNDLKRHVRTHSVKLDFHCDKCSSSFSCPSNLKRHKVVHMPTKPFQCGQCSSSFTRQTEWKRHVRMHTKKDLFMCHLCDMTFSRKHSVKRHLLNKKCGNVSLQKL